MTDYKFSADVRKEKAKTARNQGIIPAIIYGNDFKNVKLSLEKIGFNRIYKEAGTSNLIDLEIDNDSYKVLIHDIQQDPISNQISHVDFYKVDMKKKITTEIPLEFVGTSPLVIEQEGSQIINRDEIEVECLPTDLVDHIEVDVSKIVDFEQNIKVSDIKIPEAFEVLTDKEEIIVSIQPPRSEEELEALDEEVVEDVDSVEVEAKGEDEESVEEDGGDQPKDDKPEAKQEKPEGKSDDENK